jgi:hypothetical protein
MMQTTDPEDEARMRRVQQLCAQLTRLVTLSQKQRRNIDGLLIQLEAIARQANDRMPAKARRSDMPGQ